jgi:hypothetical protein
MTTAIDNLQARPAVMPMTATQPARGDGAFEALLEKRTAAREAARQFVATAFITPVLQMMRSSPLGSDLLHGGHGEDVFAAQLDTLLADRLVERMDEVDLTGPQVRGGSAVVDAIYRQTMRHHEMQQGGLNVRG